MKLRWTKVPQTLEGSGGDADSNVYYEIYGDTTDDGCLCKNSQLLASVGSTVNTWDHTGLTSGTNWYYRLLVRNRGILPAFRMHHSARAIGCPTVPPTGFAHASITYETAMFFTWPRVDLVDSDRRGYDVDEHVTYVIRNATGIV